MSPIAARGWDATKRCGRFLKKNPWSSSLFEAVVVLVFSNAALIFYVFAHLVSTAHEKFSFPMAYDTISSAVSPAEIFVYILALVAPSLYVMVFRWRGNRDPLIYSIMLLAQFGIIVGSSYIYGKAKFGVIENTEFVEGWARNCYIVGLIIWYIGLVYDKRLKDPVIPTSPESGQDILRELGRTSNG